jgi:Ca2+-transporting ATPase
VNVVTEDVLATVRQLKEAGAVVAATGKSVDDVPLLSEAQVGLSMGNATAMAKEASDITIQDNSFKSIVAAIMWGRSLYRNVQRFMAFQLIISLTAMVLCLVGSFANTELPLSVTQILWINIIIDTLASLALSTVPPSIELMAGRPRKVEDSLLTPAVKRYVIGAFLTFTVVLVLILLYFNRWGGNMDVSDLTVLFTVFVSLQFWALLNIRSLGSRHSVFYQLGQCKSLLMVLALILVGQIVFVQFGGEVFHTQPLSIWQWLGCLGLSSFVLWIGEAWRLIK